VKLMTCSQPSARLNGGTQTGTETSHGTQSMVENADAN
jgi:hypothetical protein